MTAVIDLKRTTASHEFFGKKGVLRHVHQLLPGDLITAKDPRDLLKGDVQEVVDVRGRPGRHRHDGLGQYMRITVIDGDQEAEIFWLRENEGVRVHRRVIPSDQ